MSQVEGGEAPLRRTFMEQLFGSLREDFATLKWEIAEDLRREVTDLGQHVDTLEQIHGAWEEKVDSHRWELHTLQDKNCSINQKTWKKRSRQSNIRIKDVPTQAAPGPLEDFVA
ncbi:hypothetical protein NDU88_003255 [Pleurodeles waltl]|uniref:Uncharacterized protein n=1 Tax=Pleurodeles waltl TaxID=8319 RepID=A0AAV7M4T3_PLEWA|nr:hypothetical protein NDU88_003255 [Pleurodeles waltl]